MLQAWFPLSTDKEMFLHQEEACISKTYVVSSEHGISKKRDISIMLLGNLDARICDPPYCIMRSMVFDKNIKEEEVSLFQRISVPICKHSVTLVN